MQYAMLGDLFISIYKDLKTKVERELRQYDLGMGQMQIMMCYYSDVTLVRTQSDLVKILGVDKGNINRSIAKLLAKGYIEQDLEYNKYYRLTEKGMMLKYEIFPIFSRISELMIEGIMQDDVNQTISTLRKISQNLEKNL
jgi:DNA-binding MarR family transcriptional regulator